MLGEALSLMLLVMLAMWFWQLRQIAELAQFQAQRACKQQPVQFLAISMLRARPSIGGPGGLTWRVSYQVEFSTDGINRLQAELHMQGRYLQKIDWPVFPEPDWSQAPQAKGRCAC